jgi:serine phosphatase RsbU (regulator of sigma subunit)
MVIIFARQRNQLMLNYRAALEKRPVKSSLILAATGSLIAAYYYTAGTTGLPTHAAALSISALYFIITLAGNRLINYTPLPGKEIRKSADVGNRADIIKDEITTRNFELSSKIQSSAIAVNLPSVDGVKFGAFFIPRGSQGVDYFDFIRRGSHGIGFIASDISDRGVKGAVYSVLMRSVFHACRNSVHLPGPVLSSLSRVINEYSDGEPGRLTAFCAYINSKSKTLVYSNSGFSPLLLFRSATAAFEPLDAAGAPLGGPSSGVYDSARSSLQDGDIGLLYSRSLVSSCNPSGEKFGMDRLENAVSANNSLYPSEIVRIINDSFTSFIETSAPESDVILIIFRIEPLTEKSDEPHKTNSL